MVVDAILGIGRLISRAAKELRDVGFVVAEQKRRRTPCGSGPAASSMRRASVLGDADRAPVSPDASRMTGLATPSSQDQRLRNQSVGRIWSSAGSGPALRAVMRMKTSSGAALA